MKKTLRFIAVISLIALVFSIFSACGSEDDDSQRNEKRRSVKTEQREKDVKGKRPEHDGKEFTFWTIMDGLSQRAGIVDYNDMLMFKELEKATGVHIRFMHPIAGSSGNEAFITMISSDDRAELVDFNWSAYPGGPQQAIDDGVIIALNDYLKENAPNFYACVSGDEGHFIFREGLADIETSPKYWKAQSTTADGQFYGFNVLNIGTTRGFGGLYIRGDLLKKWGMGIPTNIAEWETVFAKAKSEGIQYPFSSTLDVISFNSYGAQGFNTAYGVGKGVYLENNKVVFAPFQPGYKEYVAKMAEWVKKGYLDPSFSTNDGETVRSHIVNNRAIASWGYIGGDLGTITPAGQKFDPNFEVVACPFPSEADGTPSKYQMTYVEASDRAIAITYNCGNYEKAMQWADYFYSKEGAILNIFGVEGYTFTKEETADRTVYTYTDRITNYHGFNSIEEALYYYMLPCNHPGFNQHPDYLNAYYPFQTQKDALITWNLSSEESKKHAIPSLNFTQDELDGMLDVSYTAEAPLETAINEIIRGEASIDTYDAAIAKAKPEYKTYIKIHQDAYNRYLKKMK
ncbi:MAG: extracellular solute-binding protein [Ruminococcaceae bacterium]|nr:extracellular solute-binding protein [Oscillospiraceae bacterium]